MFFKYLLVFTLFSVTEVLARDDGIALTPPMGWMSWQRFQCVTDCKTYPDSCINEELYKAHADRLVKDGYKELGYDYVNLDDCWSEMERDSNHRLVGDKKLFPNGIKGLADYMHSKGLKLGIYGDIGTQTCAKYPAQNSKNGSNYYKIDAKTFAEWGVDSFKFDGCNQDSHEYDKLYTEMGQFLNESGRKILYNCEWPFYELGRKIASNYDLIGKTCHTFRNYQDIYDSWQSVSGIINHYGENNALFIKHNGPGHYFDPDMLIIGDYGLSYEQSKTQMSMWAMWSSPLMMSNDLRKIKPELKAILQNKAVIAVNQDKHGIMAKRVVHEDFKRCKGCKSVWVKQVEPIVDGVWSHVVLYLETYDWGDDHYVSHKVSELIPGLKSTTEFEVHDLWNEEIKEKTVKSGDHLTLKVAVSGASRMVKLTPKK